MSNKQADSYTQVDVCEIENRSILEIDEISHPLIANPIDQIADRSTEYPQDDPMVGYFFPSPSYQSRDDTDRESDDPSQGHRDTSSDTGI